jgi:hypothetical protein
VPSYSFDIRKPGLDIPGEDSTNFDEVVMARAYEKAMRSPARFDPNHPDHFIVNADVDRLGRAIFGDKPCDGGQPFQTFTFNAIDGTPIDSTARGQEMARAFNPEAVFDEHNKTDFLP